MRTLEATCRRSKRRPRIPHAPRAAARPRTRAGRRGAWTVIALAAALGLGACGGDEERKPRPALQPDVSQNLSSHAREITNLVSVQDRCGAVRRARQLRSKVQRMSEDGKIHRRLREPLLSGIDAVIGRLPQCVVEKEIPVPVPTPPPQPEEEDKKEDDKKKDKAEQQPKDDEGNEGPKGDDGEGGGSGSGTGILPLPGRQGGP